MDIEWENWKNILLTSIWHEIKHNMYALRSNNYYFEQNLLIYIDKNYVM